MLKGKKILINVFKYSTLVFLFWILIRFTKFYGDYCESVYDILFIIPFTTILILINIIILYRVDYRRKSYKITNCVILILAFVFFTHLLLNYLNSSGKEIEQNLVYENSPRNVFVYLYKDNTYEVYEFSPHVSCHYFGKYNFKNYYLTFDDKIENLNHYQFAKKYKLNLEKNEYESLEKGFPNLVIEKY